MHTNDNIQNLKNAIALEVKHAFSLPCGPHYTFSVEEAIETLFDILNHKTNDSELDAVGEQIVDSFFYFLEKGKLINLTDRCEPFAKFILKIVDPIEFAQLQEQTQNKLTFAPVLKKLRLINNKNLSAKSPEKLQGFPNFAEHVFRTYSARNKIHDAPTLSKKEIATIFESICIFFVFIISEHKPQLDQALLVDSNQECLYEQLERFKKWHLRFVELESKERIQLEFEGIDPIASECLWNTEDISDVSRVKMHGKIIEILNEVHQIILLGVPGSGKTTTLEYFAWHLANELINNPSAINPFPVYIQLNLCSPERGKSLINLIKEKISLPFSKKKTVFSKNIILFLDGLNEVRKDYRNIVIEDINELIAKFPDLRIVVTSRPGLYKNQLNRPILILQAFTDEQISEFLIKHFPEESLALEFNEALRTHPKLLEWARNPFMLALLTKLGIGKGGQLPNNRGKLMQFFISGIFNREYIKDNLQTDAFIKENLLSFLAFYTRSQGKIAFSMQECLSIIKKKSIQLGTTLDIVGFVNEVLYNNLLAEIAHNELCFAHEIYQEYFAAIEIENKIDSDSKLMDILAADPLWEEPLILYSGLTNFREDFIKDISSNSPLLAAKSLTSSIKNESALKKIVAQKAITIASNFNTKDENANSLLALVELGEFRVLGRILNNIIQPTRLHREAIESAINIGNAKQILGFLETLIELNGSSNNLFDCAVAALEERQFQNLDEDTCTRLIDLSAILRKKGKYLALIKLISSYYPVFDKVFNSHIIGEMLKCDEYLCIKKAFILIREHNYEKEFPPSFIVQKLLEIGSKPSINLAFNIIDEHGLKHVLNPSELIKMLLEIEGPHSLNQAIKMIKDHCNDNDFLRSDIVVKLLKQGDRQCIDQAVKLAEKHGKEIGFPTNLVISELLDAKSQHRINQANNLIVKFGLKKKFPLTSMVVKLLEVGTSSSINQALNIIRERGLKKYFTPSKIIRILLSVQGIQSTNHALRLIERYSNDNEFPASEFVLKLLEDGNPKCLDQALSLTKKHGHESLFPTSAVVIKLMEVGTKKRINQSLKMINLYGLEKEFYPLDIVKILFKVGTYHSIDKAIILIKEHNLQKNFSNTEVSGVIRRLFEIEIKESIELGATIVSEFNLDKEFTKADIAKVTDKIYPNQNINDEKDHSEKSTKIIPISVINANKKLLEIKVQPTLFQALNLIKKYSLEHKFISGSPLNSEKKIIRILEQRSVDIIIKLIREMSLKKNSLPPPHEIKKYFEIGSQLYLNEALNIIEQYGLKNEFLPKNVANVIKTRIDPNYHSSYSNIQIDNLFEGKLENWIRGNAQIFTDDTKNCKISSEIFNQQQRIFFKVLKIFKPTSMLYREISEFVLKDLINKENFFHAAFWVRTFNLHKGANSMFDPASIAQKLIDNNDFGDGLNNFGRAWIWIRLFRIKDLFPPQIFIDKFLRNGEISRARFWIEKFELHSLYPHI